MEGRGNPICSAKTQPSSTVYPCWRRNSTVRCMVRRLLRSPIISKGKEQYAPIGPSSQIQRGACVFWEQPRDPSKMGGGIRDRRGSRWPKQQKHPNLRESEMLDAPSADRNRPSDEQRSLAMWLPP